MTMTKTKVSELSMAEQKLYAAAVKIREHAYIPYSHFAVGAAVLCADGRMYAGCNVENASYGLCCCGERNAVFAAVCAGERELQALCVVADTAEPVSPCGACRQVMNEFKIGKILLGNLEGDIISCTVKDLLPYGFTL